MSAWLCIIIEYGMKKNICCLVFLFIFASHFSSIAQIREGSKWLNEKAVLKYNVYDGNKPYLLILRDIKFNSEISFNWMMSSPVNTSGKNAISSIELDSSSNINIFERDASFKTHPTTVWFSKKIYLALKKKTPIIITINSIEQQLSFKYADKCWAQKAYTGLQINVLYAETDKGNKFWILDDKDHPLII